MQYDIVIIGAGPGGYSAALRAQELGARFLLIEKDQVGGTCLNRGCIPTKTLIKCASVMKDVKKSELYGIDIQNYILNFEKIMERKNKVVSALKSGMYAQLKAKGIGLIEGEAKITGIHEVSVNERKIETESIIIAAGSVPAKSPIPGIEDESVVISEEALSLEKIPSSIVIIGGGVIGFEFAVIFNEFGSKVCVVEMKDRILPENDEDISIELKKILVRSGIEIINSACVKNISNGVVLFEKDGTIHERSGEKVLVSTGRTACAEKLFDSSINIKTNHGFIETDNYMRTSINNIFAVGDINGKYMLAHVAAAEGIIAVENALGRKSEMSYDSVPGCIYSFPEAASVGINQKDAEKAGMLINTVKTPVRSNGRALADGSIEGFSKIISEKTTGRILGVHIIAPYASEMISEGTMAIKYGIKDKELASMIHPHPSVSEILGETAHCVSLLNKND